MTRNQEFFQAAGNGDLEKVKMLLKLGVNIQTAQDLALRGAASKGQTETVKFLIKKGAFLAANEHEALTNAAEAGHTETVMALLAEGAQPSAAKDRAIHTAIKFMRRETILVLLEAGNYQETKPEIALKAWASMGEEEKTLQCLRQWGKGFNERERGEALTSALKHKEVKTAQLILRWMPDKELKGWSYFASTPEGRAAQGELKKREQTRKAAAIREAEPTITL
jgi:hypothetical protein